MICCHFAPYTILHKLSKKSNIYYFALLVPYYIFQDYLGSLIWVIQAKILLRWCKEKTVIKSLEKNLCIYHFAQTVQEIQYLLLCPLCSLLHDGICSLKLENRQCSTHPEYVPFLFIIALWPIFLVLANTSLQWWWLTFFPGVSWLSNPVISKQHNQLWQFIFHSSLVQKVFLRHLVYCTVITENYLTPANLGNEGIKIWRL